MSKFMEAGAEGVGPPPAAAGYALNESRLYEVARRAAWLN